MNTPAHHRLTMARAEHARIKNSILKGALVERDYANSVWWRAVGEARLRFKALPHALAGRLGLTKEQTEALDDEIGHLVAALFDGADADASEDGVAAND